MRTIKFRAKDKNTGEWVYGYLTKCGDYYIDYEDQDGQYASVQIDPDTICEYTGVPDDYNNDLYEGDIVEVQYTDIDLDGYTDKCKTSGVIKYMVGGFDAVDIKNCIIGIFDRWYDKITKLGNIYDNPELIKSKHERTSIFKGKSISDGKWYYGCLVQKHDNCYICYRNEAGEYDTVKVDPATICNYTDTKGEDGEGLYEGGAVENIDEK